MSDAGKSTTSSIDREHRRGKNLRLAFIVCLAALAGDAIDMIPDSRGFELSSERWLQDIEFYLDSTCPAFVQKRILPVINDMTPIPHEMVGYNSSAGYDKKSTIYCAPEPLQALQYLPSDIETDSQKLKIGEARRYWRATTNEMLDCDIWLNDQLISPLNIDIVLAHEWGHCLGLRHENEEISVMNEVLDLIETPTPSIDDRAGLNVLYRLCIDETDEQNNHFMHKVPFGDGWFYGVMPAGGIWPDDVRSIGYSDC